MAHVANVKVGNDWIKLEDLISTKTGSSFTFDDSKDYFISNIGTGICFMADVPSIPSADEVIGLGLSHGQCAQFKKGAGDLYVKTHVGIADIHIEEGE